MRPDASWRSALRMLVLAAVALGLVPTRAAEPVVVQQVTPAVGFVQGESALGNPQNRNFISNAGFVVTGDGVVVVDALGSPVLARELIAAIHRVTPLPVTHVIVTHYHADHIYGLQAFKELGATIIAHELAREYLNSDTARLRLETSRVELAPWVDGSTQLVAADRWLSGPTDLTIGGVLFQIRPVGPAHTPEDLVVYVPSQGVLFSGDLVFRGRVPYVGQADSRHWIASLDELLGFRARIILPGHGPVSREPQADLELTRDYLVFLRGAMAQAAREMEPFETAYARTDWHRFEQLPLFHVANRMNAYNTYLLMEQEHDAP